MFIRFFLGLVLVGLVHLVIVEEHIVQIAADVFSEGFLFLCHLGFDVQVIGIESLK